MKGLHQFMCFDLGRFLEGKTLVVTSINDLTDYNSSTIIGKKIECAIIKDDTVYTPGKDGSMVSNLFEKVLVKVKLPHTVDVSIGTEVALVNATATVYGDYRNKLSITAERVVAAENQKEKH